MLARRVDQHPTHSTSELVSQNPQGERKVLVDDLARLRLHRSHPNVVPELIQISHVLLQALYRHALRGRTQDVTAGRPRGQQPQDRAFQSLSLGLVIDPRGDTDAVAPWHVHEIAGR